MSMDTTVFVQGRAFNPGCPGYEKALEIATLRDQADELRVARSKIVDEVLEKTDQLFESLKTDGERATDKLEHARKQLDEGHDDKCTYPDHECICVVPLLKIRNVLW